VGHARLPTIAQEVARVVWTRRAAADVHRIERYIAHFNPLAAQRLALRLTNAAQSLELFPDRGRPVGQGRRELLSVKPYLIRDRVVGDDVVITSVRHGARRPLP